MNVLFVCAGNVARSQMAKALFNSASRHKAESAGTMVGIHDGQALQDAAGRVVRLMMQEGLDLSTTGRRQLTASMLTNADLVVVMAHRETWPEYLHENRNVVCWDVEDPHGMPDNFLIDVKEQIREKVVELVRSIG